MSLKKISENIEDFKEFLSNQSQEDTDIEDRRDYHPKMRQPRTDLRRKKTPLRDKDIEKDKIEKRQDTGTSVYRKNPKLTTEFNPTVGQLQVTANLLKNAIEDKFEKQPEEKNEEPQQSAIRELSHADYDFDPENLKDLVEIFHLTASSLDHLYNAASNFSKLKSRDVSPDGKLGGKGYVKTIKEIRAGYHEAVEILSDLCDTLHDECLGDQWKVQAQPQEIKEMIDESEELIQKP